MKPNLLFGERFAFHDRPRLPPTDLTPADIQTMLRWNREDPPTLWERHRNQAIQELQGNRNPFIDHPEWADKVDFLQAFPAQAQAPTAAPMASA